MFRVFILFGFAFYLMQLHITGDISKYINMKYSYLSLAAMIAAFLLGLVQLIMIFRDEDLAHDHEHNGHTHEGENTFWRKILVYGLLIYPLIAGFMFPIATLNSTIVDAKGFHFPKNDAAGDDPYAMNQFLKPDTSGYFGKSDYDKMIAKEKAAIIHDNPIKVTDANYLMTMEIIYTYLGEFEGKQIEFTGFVYNDPVTKGGNLFVFRFGIIHCVADSGVYGMLVHMPDEETDLANDTWVKVSGTIAQEYYAPFKMDIPAVKVEKYGEIPKPKDVYVYRTY
ncbi:TIGR03943 family putative permease subunit [Listeria booriae]|uniref:TIGR03943 family putative permease subunit n=1 Tax=Listeria booriae TaxID=1552123 RepID=UPI001627A835|nr:TIGR03943 family protein [Listeria booriae]MBC2066449.1 TIGR03943 family protein [Listeria booriae]